MADLKNPGDPLYSYVEVAPGILERTTRQRQQKTYLPEVDGEEVSEKTNQETINETWVTTVDHIDAESGEQVPPPPKLYKHRDEETGTLIWTQRSIVAPNAVLPAFGSVMVEYEGHYVCDPTKEEAISDSPNKLHIITFCQVPTGYVEYLDVSFPFPGIHKNGGYYYGAEQQEVGQLPPPYAVYPGTDLNTYMTIAPRNATRTARRTVTFSLTPGGALPQKWSVVTPGVSSKFFDIPPNTIHGPLATSQVFYDGDGDEYARVVVEEIPASTPATYDPDQILVIGAEKRKWKGAFYKKEIIEISERTLPHEFPAVYQIEGFFLEGQGTEYANMPSRGTILVKSSNIDTNEVTIYGVKGDKRVQETITLDGLNWVETEKEFDSWEQVIKDGVSTGTVVGRAQGTPAGGVIAVYGNLEDGASFADDTFSKTYVARTVPSLPFEFLIGANRLATLENFKDVIEAEGEWLIDIGDEDPENGYDFRPVTFSRPQNAEEGGSYDFTITGTTQAEIYAPFGQGQDGELLFQLDLTELSVFRSRSLRNDQLLFADTSVSFNLPRGLNLVTNPIALSPGTISLQLIATGMPLIDVDYETSEDGEDWDAGTTNLPRLGGGTIYNKVIAETNKNFIRLVIDNSGQTRRQVHMAVRYPITS